jgi:PADR1 (NUC008) domain
MKLRERKPKASHVHLAPVKSKPLNAIKKEKVVKPTKKAANKKNKKKENSRSKSSEGKISDLSKIERVSDNEDKEEDKVEESEKESSFTLSGVEGEDQDDSQSGVDSDYSFKKKSAKKKIKKQKVLKRSKNSKPIPLRMGYTDDQLIKYKNLAKEYASKNIKDLKAILRLNQQSMTGTKDELISKVADGEIKGAIPKCAKCGGGYLKYDYKTDLYSCKGYVDHSSWHFCRFRGNGDDVNRLPWILSPDFASKSS